MTPEDPALARDRLSAVAFVASLLGHKARNRLALVRAGLELLEAGCEEALSPEYRKELLNQLDRFLGDFNLGMEMIRCDFGDLELGSLGEMVAESVAAFRPHADLEGITLRVEGPKEGDELRADRRLLRLVLLNLLRNAQEAGAKTICVQAALTGKTATVSVSDDGHGVEEEIRPKLFESAVSTRPGGTGLGLLLCRDGLAIMGGSIRCVATEKGAQFELTIPRS